jgi:hypothetical protein
MKPVSPLCRMLAMLSIGWILGGCGAPNQPTGTIERKYYAPGPWAVTFVPGTPQGACCDSKRNPFDLYFPTNLGANGFHHPIITWGNGTNFGPPGPISQGVDYFLRHLASWGFVVVATQDGRTGAGQTILDAANFLIRANTDSSLASGIFVNKLQPTQVGAIGHSQGAGGVLNAMILSNGGILTAISIELPAQIWCFCDDPNQLLDVRKITGPVFLVDGSLDIPVSPPTQKQPASVIGLQSIAAYYDAVPSSVQKLKATLIGPTHNDISGQPGCDTARAEPCFKGVYGYLGYLTAWMADRLQVDPTAHAAFVQGTGEIFQQRTNWEFVQSNI